MSEPENPPAFPHHDSLCEKGMTLRDWFAGQMIGQCVHNALCEDGTWAPENVAYHAYLVADAMLAERKRQP